MDTRNWPGDWRVISGLGFYTNKTITKREAMLPLKDQTSPIVVLAILQVLSATYFLDIANVQALDSFLFLFTGVGISLCLLQVPSIQIRKDSLFNRQLLFKL